MTAILKPIALSKLYQDVIVDFLQKRAQLEGVEIIGRRENDIESDIESAVANAGGVCIYVFPALPQKISVNGGSIYVDDWEIRIRCIEEPKLNAKMPDCFELVEEVLVALFQQTFSQITSLSCLTPRTVPVEEQPDSSRRIKDVLFHAESGLRAE